MSEDAGKAEAGKPAAGSASRPTPPTPTPSFLSTLSPRKTAPLTATTRGDVAVVPARTTATARDTHDGDDDAGSMTQAQADGVGDGDGDGVPIRASLSPSTSSSGSSRSSSTSTSPTTPRTRAPRPDLSRRIGSAMNSMVIDGDGDGDGARDESLLDAIDGANNVIVVPPSSRARAAAEKGGGVKGVAGVGHGDAEAAGAAAAAMAASSSSSAAAAPSDAKDTNNVQPPAMDDSPGGPAAPAAAATPPPFWSTWTSKAANGSLSMLRQGTSAAAAGWGSAVRVTTTNPFRAGAAAAAGNDGDSEAAGKQRDTTKARTSSPTTTTSANDPSAASSSTSKPKPPPSAQSSHRPPARAITPDSDLDDVNLVRSAAASLRRGAKDEEKRRRRAAANASASTATAAATTTMQRAHSGQSGGGGGGVTDRSASPSPSNRAATAARDINVVHYASCGSAPKRPPERRYFVLTQAGKPVFVSHLAAQRLAREEVARARLKELSVQRRRRERWRPEATGDVLRALDDDEKRATAAEEAARHADTLASDAEEEDGAVQVGVLQALVSNYAAEGTATLERKSIEILQLPARTSRVVFLLKDPLYLAVTSTWHSDAHDGADGDAYADSASLLRSHLDILHAGVISLLSQSQLQRLFARGFNFDLRRMLEGTDGILSSLVARMQEDVGLLLGAGGGGGGGVCLSPTRMDLKLREDLGSCLSLERWEQRPLSVAVAAVEKQRNASSTAATTTTATSSSSSSLDPASLDLRPAPPRPRDLLYVLLVSSEGQLITMLRPRKLSAFPLDLHLLLNTINGMSRKAAREVGTVNWVPICLPRFAPQGMVQAHVSWLGGEGSEGREGRQGKHLVERSERSEECEETRKSTNSRHSENTAGSTNILNGQNTINANTTDNENKQCSHGDESYKDKRQTNDAVIAASCALVIVTADRESFEEISTWRDGVVQALALPSHRDARHSALASLSHQLASSPVSPDALHLPGLRHFVLKKRDDLQVVESAWAGGGDDNGDAADTDSRERVLRCYARGREWSIAAAKSKRKKRSDKSASEGSNTTTPPTHSYTHYFQTPHECVYVDCPPPSKTGTLPPYEVYLTLSPHVPPATARKIAREVLRWGLEGKEKWRLWMGRGSVF